MEPSKILKVDWPSTAAYVWHTRDLQSFAVLWFASCMKNLCCVTLIVASFLSTAHAEDRDMLLRLDLWLCETEVATGLYWNSEEWVAVSKDISIDDVRWLLRVPTFKIAYWDTEEAQRFGIVEDYRSRVAYLDYEDCSIPLRVKAPYSVRCSDRFGNAFYFSTETSRFLNAGDLDMPSNPYIDENSRRLGPVLTSGSCEKLTL
jgi:hypothetical protein